MMSMIWQFPAAGTRTFLADMRNPGIWAR